MRVLFGIAVSMVHTVHNSISARVQERRALGNERKQIEKTLPEFIHGKHLMGCITMMKKSLAKQRQEPVR